MSESIEKPGPDKVKTTCEICGKTDNHPKAAIYVGVATVFGGPVYHPHDQNKDGWIDYHFNCLPDEWLHIADPAHVEAAKSGIQGDELRALIKGES